MQYQRFVGSTANNNYASSSICDTDVGCISAAVIPSLDPACTVSDHILTAVLALLKKEVSEHGRHIAQYFHLFLSYSNLGIPEVSRAVKCAFLVLLLTVSVDCYVLIQRKGKVFI